MDIERVAHTKPVIPKIIHQSWKTEDLSTYANGTLGLESQNSWKRDYPAWEYMFWTDDDITTLLDRPENKRWKSIYKSLPLRIQQIDFSRYLILYVYGGMYADMDFISNQPVPGYYFNRKAFLGYRARRGNPKAYKGGGSEPEWVMGQAWFACHKHYVGLKLMMESLAKLDSTYDYSVPKDVLCSSGPEAIDKLFREHDIAVLTFPMSMIGNWEERNIRQRNNNPWHEMDKNGPPLNAYHTTAASWVIMNRPGFVGG